MSSITIRLSRPDPWPTAVTVIAGLVNLAIVVGLGLAVFALHLEPWWAWLFGGLAYLVVAYVVIPESDTSNLGIFGFVDHPFRWSDDVNRSLLSLFVVLWPGRMIAESLVRLVGLARRP